MREVVKYIEHLLVHNDCVIIPEFGGFVAQDCEATYVEEENLFLPPYRGVSFNPSLTMNDGLLVNEVATQNGISYSEAYKVVKQAVAEIRSEIRMEGSVTIHGVGCLQASEGETYEFVPLLCGIAAPALYGLDGFYAKAIELPKSDSLTVEISNTDKETVTINIGKKLIRYAAAAVIAAVFVIVGMTNLDSRSESGHCEAGVFQNLLAVLPSNETDISTIEAKSTAVQTVAKTTEAIENKTDSVAKVEESKPAETAPKNAECEAQKQKILAKEDLAAKSATKAKANSKESKTVKKAAYGPYTIVVSSAVPKEGAKKLKAEMKRAGYSEANVFFDKRMTRVIYGNYSTEAQAHSALRAVRTSKNVFAQAWVYKIP